MNAIAKVNLKKTGSFFLFTGIIIAALLIFNNYFYRNQAALANEQQSLTATGTIEATTATASFKVPGKLTNILVAEGSQVEIGQEIASLEDREIASQVLTAQGAYEAAVGQANQASQAVPLTSQQVEGTIAQTQAKVAQAEIGVRNAKQTLDQVAELYKAGATPKKSLDDATNGYDLAQKKLEEAQAGLDQAMSARLNVQVAESKYQAAEGQVKQAGGSVQTAEAYLNNTHLVAPISGFITQQYLQKGELLNAGTPVFEITDLQHTFVNIYISEDKIGRVKLNQEAEVSVDTFPDQVFKGKVVLVSGAGEFAVRKAINDQYDHDIRSFKVKIDVPNSDLLLKTGMTARVKIIEGEE